MYIHLKQLIRHQKFNSRKRLFSDRVSANKNLFADTVSANKKLFADSGVPIEKKNTLREEVYYMVVICR